MKRYSEENLNALLDGEYSTAQQVQMLSDLQEDGEATGELCRLRNVKQLVTSAYQDVPGQPARPPCRRRSFWPLATAASLLFVAAVSLLLAGAWGKGGRRGWSAWRFSTPTAGGSARRWRRTMRCASCCTC